MSFAIVNDANVSNEIEIVQGKLKKEKEKLSKKLAHCNRNTKQSKKKYLSPHILGENNRIR